MHHPRQDRRTRGRRAWLGVALTSAALSFVGCGTKHEVEVEPTHHTIEVEPIYMTVDINIRVQRELDRFYQDVVAGRHGEREQGGEL